jgi:hypothetical protein
MLIFNLNVVFSLNFFKTVLSRVHFTQGFRPEAGFPRRGVSGTPQELLSQRLCRKGCFSGGLSSGVLEPRWSNLLQKKTFVFSPRGELL